MTRRALRRALPATTVLAVFVQCASSSSDPPPACLPIVGADAASWPGDTVWGFADLHTHPAIEKAFEGNLIWGTALDDPPADANVLPMIETCPVETHKREVSSPLDRAVGALVFPRIAELSGFAHAPVGSVSRAWPDARDVVHQQMNVSGIRRAYESGLRLLFAAPTHDQAIAALLTGPNVQNGFVPKTDADWNAAKAQLDLINTIVARNQTWMAVANTPADARRIIRAEGKLAVILSLELNGLTERQTNDLIAEKGARHIIPIHLIDNDVGGTAASGDLFNLSSAASSAIYRPDGAALRYMDVRATPRYTRALGWPTEVATLQPAPLYLMPADVPYARYAGICYEPLLSCAGAAPVAVPSYVELGQENLRGLCRTAEECAVAKPGKDRIRALMARRDTFIDLTHMSRRSVLDALSVGPDARPDVDRCPDVCPGGRCDYPLIASHGDVNHVCENPLAQPCDDDLAGPINERAIEAGAARELVRRHGVLGLGTGTGNYSARTVLAARGGPLFTLTPAAPSACVANRDLAGACAPAPNLDALDTNATLGALRVETLGGIPSDVVGNASPFVRIEMRSRAEEHFHQRRTFVQPMQCTTQACSATVTLGLRDEPRPLDAGTDSDIPACMALDAGGPAGTVPYTVDDIESVSLEWEYLACDAECQRRAGSGITRRQCRTSWDDDRAPHWQMDQITLSTVSPTNATTLVRLEPRGAPLVDLGRTRGQFRVFDRHDRPGTAARVPATGHLLRVTLRTAPGSTLAGASPSSRGSNVCVALRRKTPAGCVLAPPPLPPGATECPAGWSSLNQRGAWGDASALYTFARFDGSESDVCGADVAVLDWARSAATLSIDDVRVEAIEDPVGRLVRRYAELSRQIAGGRLGVFALGTDFNGLNGMTDISEFPVPQGARTAAVCPVHNAPASSEPAPLAPMHFRDDGRLGAPVLIEERGLAHYGLLADAMAIVSAYPGCGMDVHDSLMLSAEATIRAWEWIVDPCAAAERERRYPLPTRAFACGKAPGLE